MDFVIGGVAGAGATIFTNPVDVVKTRMQLQGELRARKEHQTRYRGVLHALYVIARTDGLLALQKGLAPAMLFGFCMNSVRLGLYHMVESHGWTKNKDGDIIVRKTIFWSSASGILSGIAGNPASVVKTRIQAASHPSIAVGRQHSYNGTIDAFKTIYRTEGMRGIFAGVNATCFRLAIGSTAQLTTFSTSKQALLNYGICKESPFGLAFAASSLSGVAVALAICPFDVATVRLYNQGKADSADENEDSSNKWHLEFGTITAQIFDIVKIAELYFAILRHVRIGSKALGGQLYSGVLDCLSKIYKTEGLHGLYKGLGPLYLRIAPHTTLSLVIWDMLNTILLSNKNS